MKVLILRLEAPLMSFGTVAVDNWRPSGPFPALPAVTGLLGAALGHKRHQTDALQRLQERLRLASRIDRRGQALTDYQTVDLGQPRMDGSDKGVGWTTRHQVEARGKGQSNRGTHIHRRQYWADAVATLAITLEPAEEDPSVGQVAEALRRPCHPLFLGRKGCPPAAQFCWWSGKQAAYGRPWPQCRYTPRPTVPSGRPKRVKVKRSRCSGIVAIGLIRSTPVPAALGGAR